MNLRIQVPFLGGHGREDGAISEILKRQREEGVKEVTSEQKELGDFSPGWNGNVSLLDMCFLSRVVGPQGRCRYVGVVGVPRTKTRFDALGFPLPVEA